MNNQTAQSILKSWPEDSREAAQLVIDKYGEPDEVTETMLIWHNNAPWVKTIATRKAHEHLFPVPHIDAVEQYIRYQVPAEKMAELTRYDGSVMYRRTEGLLSARCHDEEANFLALNLAHAIITGEKTADEARQAYLQSMKDFRAGKPTPLMERLTFQPRSDAADPDHQLASKEEMEAIEKQNT